MILPKTALLAAGFAVLAVAAVTGWARKPSSYEQNAQPVSAIQPCVSTAQPAAYETPYPDDRYVSDQYVRHIHRPVRIVNRESAPVYTEREVVRTHEGRSKKKSIAIVAGSAAGGAAIGAIAGGGKGAGIGALAGGGAGFIYDRLTHNHR